jgi:adenylate cyclase
MDEKWQIASQEVLSGSNIALCDDDATSNPRVDGAITSIFRTLTPYLPAGVTSGSDSFRRIKKQHLTILSVDIRGFTTLAEALDPEDCLNLLNEYFAFAVEIVFDFAGEIDKFQGDGFMAVFKETAEGENHERRAVQAALRLREMGRDLNLPEKDGARIPLGMGINTGIAAFGNIGSTKRSEYTVIGDVVNVAHHLQRISGPDQIILGGNTQRRIGTDIQCSPLGYLRVKRRLNRIEAFLIE